MQTKTERRRVLLLASYCGLDDASCTDTTPCRECLEMCNVADVDCTILAIHGGLDFVRERGAPHPSEVPPASSRAQDEVTERSQDGGGAEPLKAETAKS